MAFAVRFFLFSSFSSLPYPSSPPHRTRGVRLCGGADVPAFVGCQSLQKSLSCKMRHYLYYFGEGIVAVGNVKKSVKSVLSVRKTIPHPFNPLHRSAGTCLYHTASRWFSRFSGFLRFFLFSHGFHRLHGFEPCAALQKHIFVISNSRCLTWTKKIFQIFL